MQLLYFRGKQQNFGDDLNAELWPRLLPGVFDERGSEGFLGIGTILGMKLPACDPLHVFSSGAGYLRLDDWHAGKKVWCVRGPLTARLLGCPHDAALTDGAILAPDVYEMDEQGQQIGVVPHWESLHFPGWKQAGEQAGMVLISPADTPANVINALRRCRFVLTESLHGAIMADAMGIPWVPFISTRNVSAFKWVDWCLSVDVAYAPALVPPPSAEAALTFGRPDRVAGEKPRTYDAEAALSEYRGRIEQTRTAQDSGARRFLIAGAKRAARHGPLVGRAMGFHPGRTAEALHHAAAAPPQLSRLSLRASLRDRMMDRLDALARFHTGSVGRRHAAA